MSSTLGAEPETSPSRTGFASTLGRSRRKKQHEGLESSRSSMMVQDDTGGKGLKRLKDSIDAAVDKMKPRSSAESRRDSDSESKQKDGSGLQDLLRRAKRKAKRNQAHGEDQDEEMAERGRRVAERGTLDGSLEPSPSSPSLEGMGLARSESSLLTFESESESHAVPPTFTSRPSHAGYLTLSSPLVQTAEEEDGSKVSAKSSNEDGNHRPDSTNITTQPTRGSTPEQSARDVATSSNPRSSIQPAPANLVDGREEPASRARASGKAMSAFTAERTPASSNPVIHATPFEGIVDTPTAEPVFDRASAAEELRRPGDHVSSAQVGFGTTSPTSRPYAQRPAVVVEKPRLAISGSGNVNAVPSTPPSGGLATPVTTVTPPTPTERHAGSAAALDWEQASARYKARKANSNGSNPDPERSQAHRRVRSSSSAGNPSRLSRHVSPPLTPMVEESRSALSTPGVSGGPPGQGGFFSSVFSAAQNAATTLSTSLASSSLAAGNKGRGAVSGGEDSNDKQTRNDGTDPTGVDVVRGERGGGIDGALPQRRPLAIETIGMGELSLSHLGIVDEPAGEASRSSAASPRSATPRDGVTETQNGADNRNGQEDVAVGSRRARVPNSVPSSATGGAFPQDSPRPTAPNGFNHKPTSSVNGDGDVPESRGMAAVEESADKSRPQSMPESGFDKASIRSNGGDGEPEQDVRRTGSIRSRVETGLRRRREGSSATGTTIVTAVGTNASAATRVTPGMIPRLTGFAVASKKRNRDFHQLFKSVPEDDFLIEDYSAAIQKDILLHGRLYVSEAHICFNSNIFGYVTTLVIGFDEVVLVEKKNTAVVFPNAIVIQTLHARNVFASLASRESTYDLIVGIWKINHPNLRSSLNGVQLDVAGGGDRTIKAEEPNSDGQGDDGDEEAIYDEDEDGDDVGSQSDGDEISRAGSEGAASQPKTAVGRLSPAAPLGRGIVAEGDGGREGKPDNGATIAPAAIPDFLGPARHGPTECDDQAQHFDRVIGDEIILAPLGKVYSLIFGPDSGVFMTNWLQDEQKVLELHFEDEKVALTETKRSRTYSYIKPLTAAIGPRQTKCIITEVVESLDLEKAVSVMITTQTPEVPSGNVFCTRTKYCLTWAEGNATRLFANCVIEWTGKSWLKGPIEKGANEGQIVYVRELVGSIRAAITAKGPPATLGLKGRARRRKKEIAETIAQSTGKPAPGVGALRGPPLAQTQNWGALEWPRGPLGPVVNQLGALWNTNVMLAIVTLLLFLNWLRPYQPAYAPGQVYPAYAHAGGPSAQRLAAYEALWRREENSLWDWLDERVGIDQFLSSSSSSSSSSGTRDRTNRLSQTTGRRHHPRLSDRQRREAEARLAAQSMTERQMLEAIRATQSRLDQLKSMVDRRRLARDAPRADAAAAADSDGDGGGGGGGGGVGGDGGAVDEESSTRASDRTS